MEYLLLAGAVGIFAFLVSKYRSRRELGGDAVLEEHDVRSFSEIESFSLNIVGESNYQSAIKQCHPGDLVELIPEPNNPYDPNAIVVKCRGKTIGYISRDRLEWIHRALRNEHFARVRIGSIGTSGKYLGVVLSIDKSLS